MNDNPYQRRLVWTHYLVLASYLGLLVLFAVSNALQPGGSLALWLVQTLPLLLFAPGLWLRRSVTYLWLCTALLIYFIWAVTAVMSPLALWHHYVALLLIVILGISTMLASHWTHKWRKLRSTSP